MTAVLEARRLGRRFRGRWALADCTLSIPAGCVAGLVGPNGAGKSTLLHLATGQLRPTTGSIQAVGARPAAGPAHLAKVGFVAQDTPTYAAMSVADHLRLGANLNPGWDATFAADRIAALGLNPSRKAGKLSGGQRAQLALTLALAKRPELLILDEPVASLDPLARREFLESLLRAVAERGMSVVLSSHLIADLELACDYLIVLAAARVQAAGQVSDLLAAHRTLVGPRCDPATLPARWRVVSARHTEGKTTVVARAEQLVQDPDSVVQDPDPGWSVSKISLEDLVLAYLNQAAADREGHRDSEAGQ